MTAHACVLTLILGLVFLLHALAFTSGAITAPTKVQREEPGEDAQRQKHRLHDEVEREYLQYVPESYDGSTAVPVMLSFHGFGGRANDQMGMSDMRDLAESENFILIYPQGTRLEGFTHWNTYLPGGENKSEADDFGFVDAMLDVVSADYAIDSSRVYATGFSNGADFTYTLACYLSDRVTAIAPVSGLMWYETRNDCEPTHPTAVLHIHGTRDNDRPYDGIDGYLHSVEDGLAHWAEENGITADSTMTELESGGRTVERYRYEGGDGGVSMTLYKVIRGQHDWLSIEDDGVETDRLIWDFLSAHDQDGAL